MNKGILIIAAPAVAVLAGYLALIHARGLSPGYPKLALWVGGGVLGIWLARRAAGRRAASSGR